MIVLSNLKKTVKPSKRVGRGGNHVKNAGKGHKGQVKRAGKTRLGFEGGQKSLIRRTPKFKGYNFTGKIDKQIEVLSLTMISSNYKDGDTIDLNSLKEKKIISPKTKLVRLINSGKLTIKPKFADGIYLTKGVKALI